jgi:hypothetical protein
MFHIDEAVINYRIDERSSAFFANVGMRRRAHEKSALTPSTRLAKAKGRIAWIP